MPKILKGEGEEVKDREELEAERENREGERRNHIEDVYYENGMEPPSFPTP